ncbi:MAG: hypothetical protein ACI814_005023, partial [Mariniblastus sp.]
MSRKPTKNSDDEAPREGPLQGADEAEIDTDAVREAVDLEAADKLDGG